MKKVKTIRNTNMLKHDEEVNAFIANKDIRIINIHFSTALSYVATLIEYEDIE